jgi:hypothetical protein
MFQRRTRAPNIVVAVDLLFFKGHFWERLMANIGIVLLFGSFFLRFLK